MSQFFNQYNAILEKSLQKVRLKVDPSNKCAEDFAQFDGYVGYILAETDDSIEFFYDNQTVTLPKNAVVLEQYDAPQRTTRSQLTRFAQGVAGQQAPGLAGALGSIAGGAVKGLGKAALALHGVDPSKLSSQQQAAASQPAAAPGSQLKFGSNIDRSHGFAIKTVNGNAAIDINGAKYGILKGSIMDQNKKVLLNSFTFNDVISNFIVETPLSDFGTVGQRRELVSNAPAAPAAPAAPTSTAPTAPAASTAPASTTTPPTSASAPPVSPPTQFTPISDLTASNLKAKNALMVPLQVSLVPMDKNATDKAAKMHAAMFTVAPNGQEVIFNFLD